MQTTLSSLSNYYKCVTWGLEKCSMHWRSHNGCWQWEIMKANNSMHMMNRLQNWSVVFFIISCCIDLVLISGTDAPTVGILKKKKMLGLSLFRQDNSPLRSTSLDYFWKVHSADASPGVGDTVWAQRGKLVMNRQNVQVVWASSFCAKLFWGSHSKDCRLNASEAELGVSSCFPASAIKKKQIHSLS